jgi:8-oxo-dGTP pyrophosphatase MutT (NUDIX family)
MSSYLRELRAIVGQRLLVLPSVAVLPWDEQGRLLLVREAETGLWQTVGGSIEPDESPAEAALREAAEETGVVLALDGIRGVAGGPQFRLTYPNGDLVGYVATVFDAHVLSGDPRPDGEETTEVAWFTPDQLAEAELSAFTWELFAVVGVEATRRRAR